MVMDTKDQFNGFEDLDIVKKTEKPRVKISAFTMRTRKGKNASGDKKNQDSFISHANLNGDQNTHLFGVYDGHGKPTNPLRPP